MITYESLLEGGRLRGMPLTKIRGILREYVQIIILKQVYNTDIGKKLYFTGGTYLRLLHNLKRFSEDLDFNTNNMLKEDFEKLLKIVSVELGRIGLNSEISFSHWGDILVCKLLFPDIERAYNAVSAYSKKHGIIIKVETNNSKRDMEANTKLISGFGQMYPCVCTPEGVLFADKIDALVKKNRARHIYDIIFMLSNKCAIDKDTLRYLGLKEEPFEIICNRIKEFSQKDLKKYAENLRPFLFDESEADLILNAHSVMPALIKKYEVK